MNEISYLQPKLGNRYNIRTSYSNLFEAISPNKELRERQQGEVSLDLRTSVIVAKKIISQQGQPSSFLHFKANLTGDCKISNQRYALLVELFSRIVDLPESALEQVADQVKNLQEAYGKKPVFVLSSSLNTQQHSNISSSCPQISSLLGDLDKEEIPLNTLEKAQKLIEHIHSLALTNNWWWYAPLVNIGIDNEIVLEWWNKEKKITVYVDKEVIDYIKVWGADIDHEMEDGLIRLEDNSLRDLWQWISG